MHYWLCALGEQEHGYIGALWISVAITLLCVPLLSSLIATTWVDFGVAKRAQAICDAPVGRNRVSLRTSIGMQARTVFQMQQSYSPTLWPFSTLLGLYVQTGNPSLAQQEASTSDATKSTATSRLENLARLSFTVATSAPCFVYYYIRDQYRTSEGRSGIP